MVSRTSVPRGVSTVIVESQRNAACIDTLICGLKLPSLYSYWRSKNSWYASHDGPIVSKHDSQNNTTQNMTHVDKP